MTAVQTARDWADGMEQTMRPLYDAVLQRALVKGGALLDAGCGSGGFAQLAAALAEARRVATEGAAVFVATWGREQACEAAAYLAALAALLPSAPPGAPGPFALSEQGALDRLAREAGLTPGEVVNVECVWRWPNQDAALRALLSPGPAIRAIRAVGEDVVRQQVAEAIAPYRNARGGYSIENAFQLLVARA